MLLLLEVALHWPPNPKEIIAFGPYSCFDFVFRNLGCIFPGGMGFKAVSDKINNHNTGFDGFPSVD